MKQKRAAFLPVLCFFVFPAFLFADNEHPFSTQAPTFEVGFHARGIFANSFFSLSQITSNSLIIDLDEFGDGFNAFFNIGLTPFYFIYNLNSTRSLGFSIGIDAVGIAEFSDNLLTLSNAVDDQSNVSVAVFFELQFLNSFTVRNIRINASPSLFYPLFHINGRSSVNYTRRETPEGTIIDIDYKLRMHTPFSGGNGYSPSLAALPGIDFNLGAEFPLREDFTVGVDLINLPLVPSLVRSYVEFAGQIGGDETLTFDDIENLFNINEPVHGSRNRIVFRPFKMLAWVDLRPFQDIPINFVPTLGFAINPFFINMFSLEAGFAARYNWNNILFPSIGIGYHDRMWINSLGLAIDINIAQMRFSGAINSIELNLGIDMRSQSFVESWQGAGIGLNFGLKFLIQ